MLKEIIKDFVGYYKSFIKWLFVLKHNYIFNRVVKNSHAKEERENQPVFALLNKNRQFEYLTKTQYNYRLKYGTINLDTKRRLVKFYDTSEKENVSDFREKFIAYALYLKDKKK